MIAGLLGLVTLIVRLWPETPLALALHSTFVEAPLEWAGRLERRHLILIVVLLCSGQAVALLGPELALVYAVDVSLYAEAMIAASLATAAARVRFAWQGLKGAGARVVRIGRARPRAPRSKAAARRKGGAANDDDPDPKRAPLAA